MDLAAVQGYTQAWLPRGLVHIIDNMPGGLRQSHRVFVSHQR
jgi:hypothetical protein